MNVAIVGGGVAGLTTAYRLTKQQHSVSLFESTDRLGGLVHSERIDNYLIEHGAEGFVERGSPVPELCEELGLRIMPQQSHRSLLLRNGAFEAISRGTAAQILGIQLHNPNRSVELVTIASGMGSLIVALAKQLDGRCDVHLSTHVQKIVKNRTGIALTTDNETLNYDLIFVTLPPGAAARLLRNLVQKEAATLESVPATSSTVVSLAFPRDTVGHKLEESGFVVAEEDRTVSGFIAGSFTSSKYLRRAPEGTVLIRVFFRPQTDVQHSDEAWVSLSYRSLEGPLQLRARETRSWVDHYDRAIPQLNPELVERLSQVQQSLAERGVFLAGGGYQSTGVSAAVASAIDAVNRATTT